MSILFSPTEVGPVALKNRLVMSPMCMYSSTGGDGYAEDWHYVHYTARAVGGFGLIMQEATAVSPEGRISPDDLGIWNDGHIPGLSRIVQALHQYGTAAGIQLAHAGRKASMSSIWKGSRFLDKDNGGWDVVAPCPEAFNESAPVPRALDKGGIQQVIQDFTHAAARATLCGYDVIEIHAAHGYLIHEFLSPITNKRTDEYGGIFENRIRLLLEILQSVRRVMNSQQALFVRLSCVDYLSGGWTIEDSVALSEQLKTAGVHLVDCSSGAIAPGEQISAAPLYQVPFSERIRRDAGIMTGAVGLIESAADAENILQSERADVVLLGRAALRDPYVANTYYRDLHQAGHLLPPQYLRAFRK